MSTPPPPTVSTGTIPEGVSKDRFNVTIRREGKRGVRVYRYEVGPWTNLAYGRRIVGIARQVYARYFFLKGENRCMIADPKWCTMKGKALTEEELLHMDFDEINGDRLDHRISNTRPACHSCNSHQQKFQWKPSEAPASDSREREEKVQTHPHSFAPTSGETAASWRQYPKAVEWVFHPLTGRLATQGMKAGKDWLVNILPDKIGMGRATTYGKYVHEWTVQGYLSEQPGKDGVELVRTSKKADALLLRELGLKISETVPGTRESAEVQA